MKKSAETYLPTLAVHCFAHLLAAAAADKGTIFLNYLNAPAMQLGSGYEMALRQDRIN